MEQSVLIQSAEKYGIPLYAPTLVGGFNNNVYECTFREKPKPIILKFYEATSFQTEALKAEVEWVNYLHRVHLDIATPIASKKGNLIEKIKSTEGKRYVVVAYEKVNGVQIDCQNPGIWNENLFEQWGQAMGKMHEAAKNVPLSTFHAEIPHWYEERLLLQTPENIDKSILLQWK
ncbi:hypothetical protein [Virgibacillus sp. LDC-1]|uniref:phosphotransferase enzyme family protein n=1 Tax=Virgibacillus sp. LDC-1 TaxID=3039856 RepID=UPI0024DE5DDF|nr:hypothetical protein [Virgibacillus sp. LDC-1]